MLIERLNGADFADLNASYSKSLYKSVGGDIGWKSANDFPENVFAGLTNLRTGVLAEAYTDEMGTHLFMVVSKPRESQEIAEKYARERTLKELKKRRLSQYLANLKKQISHWVNPVIQTRCQINPISDKADTSAPMSTRSLQ